MIYRNDPKLIKVQTKRRMYLVIFLMFFTTAVSMITAIIKEPEPVLKGRDAGITPYLISGVILISILCFMFFRISKMLKQHLYSLTIELTDTEITFEQARQLSQRIPFSEISSIEIINSKLIHIYGRGRDLIMIGPYVKDRELLLQELEKRSVIARQYKPSGTDTTGKIVSWVTAAAIIAMILIANMITNKTVILISVAVFEALMALSLVFLIAQRKRIPVRAFNYTLGTYLFIMIVFGFTLIQVIRGTSAG